MSRDAGGPEVKILVQIVIEDRIEVDKVALERCAQNLLDGWRLQPLFQFGRADGVVDDALHKTKKNISLNNIKANALTLTFT